MATPGEWTERFVPRGKINKITIEHDDGLLTILEGASIESIYFEYVKAKYDRIQIKNADGKVIDITEDVYNPNFRINLTFLALNTEILLAPTTPVPRLNPPPPLENVKDIQRGRIIEIDEGEK